MVPTFARSPRYSHCQRTTQNIIMKTIVKSTLITVFATALCAGTTFAAKGTGGTKPKPIDPVEAYLKQNDKNKDGFIDRKEAHMGEESFAKWDKNKYVGVQLAGIG